MKWYQSMLYSETFTVNPFKLLYLLPLILSRYKSKAGKHVIKFNGQSPAKYSKGHVCICVCKDHTVFCLHRLSQPWFFLVVTHIFSLLHFDLFACVYVSCPATLFTHSMVCLVSVCVGTVCFVAMETFSILFFSAEVWGDTTEAGDVISQLRTSNVQTHEVSHKWQNRHHAQHLKSKQD